MRNPVLPMLLASLLLGGCATPSGGGPAAPSSDDAASVAAGRPNSLRSTLEGRMASLAGSVWKVEDVGGRQGLVEDSKITIAFDGDGRIAGLASCNQYLAHYEIKDDGLHVTGAASTMKACPQRLMRQERHFLSTLHSVRRITFDAFGAMVMSGPGNAWILARRQGGDRTT